jgi:DNA-binding protein HU-beta
MNKKQLAQEVDAEIKKGVSPVDAVLNVIGRELLYGNRVVITGFGTFEVVHRDERTARNPQTGERMTVPDKDVPRWRPGTRILDLLNGMDAPSDASIAAKAPKGSLSSGKAAPAKMTAAAKASSKQAAKAGA